MQGRAGNVQGAGIARESRECKTEQGVEYRDGSARQRGSAQEKGEQDRIGRSARQRRECKISQGLELHGAESRECTEQEVGSVLGGEYFERFVSEIQWADSTGCREFSELGVQGAVSSVSWESRE